MSDQEKRSGVDQYGHQYVDVDLEELTKRYMRQHRVHQAKGYGADSAEGHFALALLTLSTGRVEQITNEEEGTFYRIPEWSDYSEERIKEMERELTQDYEVEVVS